MDKYKFLDLAIKIFKGLAYVAAGLGVLSFLVILIGGGTPEAPRATGFVGLIVGAIYFLFFYTASCGISILLDIAKKNSPQS